MIDKEKLYKEHEEDRKTYTDAILNSTAKKRLVAAGPGTGKTHLFSEICKKSGENNLVLTFINELVKDLKKDLESLADVRTLHSFARRFLDAKSFFMSLTEIIEEDFELKYEKKISFKEILSNVDESRVQELKFYLERREYYNFFGPLCSIYCLIKYYEKEPDKIPHYTQILVDEFQDFNKLESKLIDTLSIKSPLLVAGDDDQSLYAFKFANPTNIRSRHGSNDHEIFQLPYCSRCPQILVDSANVLIRRAQAEGFLKGRIKKDYKYFHSKTKDEVSERNPKILFKQPLYDTQLAFQIDRELKEISSADKNFGVLIICPLKTQITALKAALAKKGFKNVQSPENYPPPSKLDGYKVLLEDAASNLGWRVLGGFLMTKSNLKEAIVKSVAADIPFKEFFSPTEQKLILRCLKILNKIRSGEDISEAEAQILFQELEYNLTDIALGKIKEDLKGVSSVGENYKNVPIKIVTPLGAKGLTSDYVFLTNFDDRFVLAEGKVNDDNVCKFLVALTRAKKRMYIYSATKNLPLFLSWIGENFYQKT